MIRQSRIHSVPDEPVNEKCSAVGHVLAFIAKGGLDCGPKRDHSEFLSPTLWFRPALQNGSSPLLAKNAMTESKTQKFEGRSCADTFGRSQAVVRSTFRNEDEAVLKRALNFCIR